MKNAATNQEDAFWALIEKENKKDRIIKRISKAGWTVTLLVLLLFLVFTVIEFIHAYKMYVSGRVLYQNVVDTLIPFLITLGTIGLIVAILGTIGMFLRLRTTSLLEVQQRLTNLEKVLSEN